MNSESNQNRVYENEGVTDIANECEYVYQQESLDNIEYVYDEESSNLNANKQESIDECTYVYDEESKKSSTTNPPINKQKPGHQRGPAGLYDETDYNLDPQIQDAPRIHHNEKFPIDTNETGETQERRNS